MRRTWVTGLLWVLAVSALVCPVALGQDIEDDPWKFSISPYVWGTGMEGTVGIRSVEADVDLGFDDILDNLDLGAMLAFDAVKGRWRFFGDVLYMSLEDTDRVTRLEIPIEVEVSQFMASAGVGYRLLGEPDEAFLEILGGARYLYMDMDLEAGDVVDRSRTEDWVDPFVGARTKIYLANAVFCSLEADAGGFGVGSDETWHAVGLIGADLARYMTLVAGYRYMNVDYDEDDFKYDMEMHGPIAGLQFKF